MEIAANILIDNLYEFSDEEILAELPETSESDADDEEENGSGIQKNNRKINFSRKPHDDSGSETSQPAGDDDDIGGWGTTKKDYYDADPIETEADALEEENEVRRLQRKQLERFTEEDFGLDELAWIEDEKDDISRDRQGSEDGVIRELLPEPEVNESTSSEERLNILRIRYPEFEPLSMEFIDLQSNFADLSLAVEALPYSDALKSADQIQDHVIQKTPLVVLKHTALRAYLGALCMYFVLLTSTHDDAGNKITAMSPMKLRDHSIMDTLVQCRQLWEKVKDISITETDDRQEPVLISNEKSASINRSETQGDILTDLNDGSKIVTKKPRKPRKSKTQKAVEAAEALAAAQRVEKMDEKLRAFSALESQIGNYSKSPAPRRQSPPSSNHSFGEETTLNDHEVLEKSQRKQSLRFYTSQIMQKSQKRDAAGRYAGGDTDIPHRERLRDRQARLNAEAESQVKTRYQREGNDVLGGESDEEDRQAAAELRKATTVDDDDDYYNIIGAKQAEKKARKEAAAAAAKAAEQGGPLRITEDEFEGGKRGLSYAIAKNKGLAPRRKKEVRNPRVKKRLKFEEKKRKLGSTRAVWKEGQGKGGYKGELTGIKTGLVRGVKL